ncbi:MAG: hypothetical protein DRI99_05240 [Candidatus Aminicenantes bacterium]|nr:MAG: hypothetical protein DRI99_05240 [Candidatus Aminicenantes bacterium]RLE03160.1 MAG: hypothetical protein DRJ11_05095 [Candidatus Aminicenantes bacterium]
MQIKFRLIFTGKPGGEKGKNLSFSNELVSRAIVSGPEVLLLPSHPNIDTLSGKRYSIFSSL